MNTSKLLSILAVAVACVSIASTPNLAEGAINQFSNFALWQASAGAIDFSENFNSFTVDTPFRLANGPLALNGFALGESGAGTESLNLVDLPPLINNSNDVNGTPFASIAIDYPANTVDLSFNLPARGFGADFRNVDSPEETRFNFYHTDGSLIATINPTPEDGFIGFVATGGDSIGYVRFFTTVEGGSIIREAFGMDNVVVASVPEPTTAALLTFAAFACGCLRRRRS